MFRSNYREPAPMTNLDYSARPSIPTRLFQALSKERWAFLITFTVLFGCGVVIIRRQPPLYSSESTILIEYPRTAEQLTTPEPTDLGKLDALGIQVSPVSNQAALLSSRPIFEKALTQLNLSEEKVPYSGLKIEPVKGTDLLKVIYQSDSAVQSAQVVEAVINVYMQENQNLNRGKGSGARKFLEKRLPELRQKFVTAQNQLEAFQTRNGLVEMTAETKEITEFLYRYQQEVTAAQAELASTTQKVNRLKTQLPTNLTAAVNAAGLSQEGGYQEIQKQLLETESQLAELKSRVTPEHPQYVSLLEERSNLITLLRQRSFTLLGQQAQTFTGPLDPLRQRLVEQWFTLEADRSAQAARLAQLSQRLQQVQQRATQLPQLMKQQTQLQLAVDMAQEEYVTFTNKYTNSQIVEEQNISNVRLVEPARINLAPVAPNRKLNYAIALVVSAAAAGGVVWWRRSRSNSLGSLAELKQILPLATLATVPWFGNGRLGRDESGHGLPLANSYRLLQAHIRMLPQNIQVIAVCSWSPQEGRSSVAANLALLEAQAGYRVLLIDGDSASPSQATFWGLSHGKEITNQHSHLTLGASSAHKVLPNLDVLPDTNHSTSTSYKEWLVLLEQARQHYDLIILDCPPTQQGPDATLQASMSDGVLWVACPERLGRQGAEASAENLRTWSSRLLGQVVIGIGDKLPPTRPESPAPGLPATPRKSSYPGLPEPA